MNQSDSDAGQQRVDKFARLIADRLTQASNELPYDIAERLRAGRVQAVEKHKWVLSQGAGHVFVNRHSATLTAGHGAHHPSWWNRLGAVGLLLTLVLGLIAISVIQDELGAQELAEIDTAILTDDLPPAAYVDSGFVQFLKTHGHQEP
jgi:hypothetical protein